MSLTGEPFLIFVVALTLAAIGGVLRYWPRFAGSGYPTLAARAGLLALVNILVVTCVAVQLNDQNLFFAGWQDLAGAMSNRPATTTLSGGGAIRTAAGTRTVAQNFTAPAVGQLPALPRPVPGDRVLTFQVRGPSSGLAGVVDVQFPPAYLKPADRDVRFPVLETFSGYPGAPAQWIKVMKLGSAMADQVAAHRLRSAIIISPQTEFPAGTDGECVNGPAGAPQVETWLSQDVPHWALKTLRVSLSRSGWATIGLSAGGWCAGMIAMKHPAQFASAIVMGGYFEPDFGPLYEPFGPGSRAAAGYDMVRLAGSRHAPPLAVWLESSQADALSYRTSVGLIDHARAPLSVQGVMLRHAGHRLDVWRAYLPEALRWLGSAMPGFRPAPVVPVGKVGPVGPVGPVGAASAVTGAAGARR